MPFNVWDIVVLAFVIALLAGAVLLYRGRRRRGGCCGDCAACRKNADCDKQKN